MGLLYTLHWVDTGIVIQSGDVPNDQCLPAIPKGAKITRGVAADPEIERIDGDVAVPWVRPREREELLAAIERERKVRLSAGFDYDFGDDRGVHRIGTSEDDERGWDKVTKLAGAYINAGRPNAEIMIVTNTGPVVVSALEWQSVLIAMGDFQQPIYAASFALQSMDQIPTDIEHTEYWT